MPDIFLSYAKEDRERIRAFSLLLETHGWSVFWDRKIPTGKTWQSHIGKALEDAKCVIVAWSSHSINSSWVYEEATEGKQRGILIPILLESIKPPLGLRSIQAANLSDWQPNSVTPSVQELLFELQLLLGSPTHQHPSHLNSTIASAPLEHIEHPNTKTVEDFPFQALSGLTPFAETTLSQPSIPLLVTHERDTALPIENLTPKQIEDPPLQTPSPLSPIAESRPEELPMKQIAISQIRTAEFTYDLTQKKEEEFQPQIMYAVTAGLLVASATIVCLLYFGLHPDPTPSPIALPKDQQTSTNKQLEPPYRLEYERSLALFRDGDLEGARKAFGAFIATHPNSNLAPNARYWLGEAYFGSKDFKRAIDAYDKVESDYPQSEKVPAAILKKGYAYLALKDNKRASGAFKQVVVLYPKTPEAGKAADKLAQLKERISDSGDTEGQLPRLAKPIASPKAPEAAKSGIPQAQTESATIVTSVPGTTPTSAFNLAYADYLNGKHELAVAGFQRFIKDFANSSLTPNAYYWLGQSYYDHKDYTQAIQAFEYLVAEYPGNGNIPAALYKIGLATIGIGDLVKSRKHLKNVIDEFPESDEAALARAKYAEIR